MAWRFDTNARRYRSDDGRFLSRERALEFAQQSITADKSVVAQLATMVHDGRLSPADWGAHMREEIKGTYIREYILGRGGRAQMDAAAWGELGGILSNQYSYLDRRAGSFLEQVAAGELSEAQIAARAEMYINSAGDAYERGRQRRLGGSHFDEVLWELHPAEHCADCLDLASRGWMPVESLHQTPRDGNTACRVNCQCTLSYRRSDTGTVFEAEETERIQDYALHLHAT